MEVYRLRASLAGDEHVSASSLDSHVARTSGQRSYHRIERLLARGSKGADLHASGARAADVDVALMRAECLYASGARCAHREQPDSAVRDVDVTRGCGKRLRAIGRNGDASRASVRDVD